MSEQKVIVDYLRISFKVPGYEETLKKLINFPEKDAEPLYSRLNYEHCISFARIVYIHWPGPMVTGIASGTTAMLEIPLLGSIVCCEGFLSVTLLLTSPTEVRKSRAPPPIRNASSVMSKAEKIYRPKNSRMVQMMNAEKPTANASFRFCPVSQSGVIERYMDNTKNGVIRKKNFRN